MIIEDVGEEEDKLSIFFREPFKREEIRFEDSEGNIERVGDYTDDERSFLVERKRWDDYINSVKSGRYLRQLNKMAHYYDGPKFLVFEGDWEAMLKVAAKMGLYNLIVASRIKAIAFGVNWIQTWSKRDTANFIMELHKYAKNNKNITIPLKKPEIKMDYDERLYAIVNSVGIKVANVLLTKYKNLYNLMIAVSEDPKGVMEIHGMGKVKIGKLQQIFYSEQPVRFARYKSKKNKKSTSSKARKKRYAMYKKMVG